MYNLFPYLLRDVNSPSEFGSTLSHIIKGKEIMKQSKKLIVYFNGEEQEAINISSIKMELADDNIILHIDTEKEEISLIEDTPSVDGILIPSSAETFLLQGDDLEAFQNLSEFHNPKNHVKEKDTITPVHQTLETSTYNIQDIQSVEQATMELLEIEQKFIKEEFKVIKVDIPKFIYEEDGIHFKLRQECDVCNLEKTTSPNNQSAEE
jgi:hypothetical protein